MKILFVIYSLSSTGGAERVISMMANHWAEKDWDIQIVTFDGGEKPPFYVLSPGVKHEPLGIANQSSNRFEGIYNNYARIVKLRNYFKEKTPDVIISFMTTSNLLTLLSTLKLNTPVIISERNDPFYFRIDPLRNKLRNILYPRASYVVFQSQKVFEYFPNNIREKGVIIPNPVIQNGQQALTTIQLPEGKKMFAIGSMNSNRIYIKGLDLLIPVFYNLSRKYPDWNLVILGDGTNRHKLEEMIQNLGLQGRVFLPGNVKNVHTVLKQGDLFVLSSRTEGFPNALCEAMSCGLPVVSFDIPTGPQEIVRHGLDGLLVPMGDTKKLENALEELMVDENKRHEMGQNAREIVDRFSIEMVMNMWEELAVNSIGERKKG